MAALILTYVRQDVVEVDDDFFSEYVLNNFSHHSVFTEV